MFFLIRTESCHFLVVDPKIVMNATSPHLQHMANQVSDMPSRRRLEGMYDENGLSFIKVIICFFRLKMRKKKENLSFR